MHCIARRHLLVNVRWVTTHPMKKDTQLSIRLSSELRAALQALADEEQRKLSDYITLVLTKHVARSQSRARS